MRLMVVVGLVALGSAGLGIVAQAQPQSQAQAEAWRASGDEPSWLLTRTAQRMTLETDFGATRLVTSAPSIRRIDRRTVRYSARVVGGGRLTATVREEVCRNAMTGMPRPQAVTLRHAGRTLMGCGGQPDALLQGRAWVVSQLADAAVLPKAKVTLLFAEGRVTGSASCNRFAAAYRVTGEGLTFEKGLSTMMACEAEIMDQESRFLAALETAARFDVGPKGELMLLAADGRTLLTAKR